ncbi:MAG: transglutaminase family protein [Verrucomicrobiota bacterium]
MKFTVVHKTEYHYQTPASESYGELRVCPKSDVSQKVSRRKLVIEPDVKVQRYTDFFGNQVEYFSIPRRHQKLSISSRAEVQTQPVVMPDHAKEITVAEARQVMRARLLEHYPYLQPTSLVPLRSAIEPLKVHHMCRDTELFADAIMRLNTWIFENFTYKSGFTEITTPLNQIIKHKKGVCQDFAHLMLSILRTYKLPARYVSGYIEAYDPETTDPNLIGATASHAWVEVALPGGNWIGLDPTNNQIAGERHVKVAVGRDYHDVAPLTGTYKGAQDQKLEVIVSVKRRKGK